MYDTYELAAETETALINDIEHHLDQALSKVSTNYHRRTSTPISEISLCTGENLTDLGDCYEKWRDHLENSRFLPKVRGVSNPPKGIISGYLIVQTDTKKHVKNKIRQYDINPNPILSRCILDLDNVNIRSPKLSDKCKNLLRQTVQLFRERRNNKCCKKCCKCRFNVSM